MRYALPGDVVAPMSTPIPALLPVSEHRQEMSYEQYLAWMDDDTHAEWVDGIVTIFNPQKTINHITLIFLHSLMNDYVHFFSKGVVVAAPFEMLIRPGISSRRPDLFFVSRSTMHERLTPERLVGPADLVVEIVSECSMSRDVHDKFYEYQYAGVKEYWIIDPRPGVERVAMYYLSPEGRYERIEADRNGRCFSNVLTGFWIRPEWFWEGLFPNAQRALTEIVPQAMRDKLRIT